MLFVFLSTGWDGTGGSIVWLLQSAMPSSAACTRSDADFECVLAMIKEGYGMIMLAAVLRRRCLTDSVVSWSWRRLFVARSDCGQCAFADCSCSLAQDLIIVTRRGGASICDLLGHPCWTHCASVVYFVTKKEHVSYVLWVTERWPMHHPIFCSSVLVNHTQMLMLDGDVQHQTSSSELCAVRDFMWWYFERLDQ